MNPSYIITPVAGAIIGYFTNWLAIKMLFKPHKQLYIGKIKVPFTPGLIPKERERMAISLGDTVGNYILTHDVLLDYLTNPEVISSLSLSLDKGFNSVKCSYLTVEQTLNNIMGSDAESVISATKAKAITSIESFLLKPSLKDDVNTIIFDKTYNLLATDIKDLPTDKILAVLKTAIQSCTKDIVQQGIIHNIIEKSLWDFLLNLRDDERKLSAIASYSSVQDAKDYLSLKTPAIVNALISLTENPEVEELIKAKLMGIIQSFAGPFMGMFINADDIYVSLIERLTVYINDPENMPEIERTVSLIVDKAMDMTIGEVCELITGEMRETAINKAIGFIITEITKSETIDSLMLKLSSYISENGNSNILDVLNSIDKNTDKKIQVFIASITNSIFSKAAVSFITEVITRQTDILLNQKVAYLAQKISKNNFETIKKTIFTIYNSSINTVAPKVLTAFNIPKIVEERINSFSIQYTEELILAIVSKELQAITAIGGVLGFIIGFLPVLINLV
ncbi:MAG TPA: hypothetical protein DIC60_01445 [Lachnospiraceae bacterium]|nr:hypothetical protein [Lachnospiraceae bacterium]